MIERTINIKQYLEKNKVLIIYGPRQVGKTTLVKEYLEKTNLKYLFFTGDDTDFANDFSSCSLKKITQITSGIDLLIIDEAQKIKNIGTALKLVIDNIPNIYIIATGSSSFDLANFTEEPLTGRKNVITLYPIHIRELLTNQNEYQLVKNIEEYLLYGMYPNILELETLKKKEERIKEIKNSYLIKDILEFNKVRNSKPVMDLLKLLAFQIGSEVSTSELGTNLGIDDKTVKRYLELLEKSFVIFRLGGYARNLRKEINKMSKYYFYDLGVRNALISNFNNLDTRNDIGQLWENFAMIERMKGNNYSRTSVNYYFWRTWDQKEIDLIEERGGNLYGYEFKWNPKKDVKAPKDWRENYKNASFEVISRSDLFEFVK